MVGPMGSPDDVFDAKMTVFVLASILAAVLSTSVSLAPFERKTGANGMIGYALTKGFWTLAMLWVAGAWWLASRSTGFGFALNVGYYAALTGSILANICWGMLYFVDTGKPQRYWASLFVMALGWMSAAGALIVLSINLWQSWAALTARASSIVAAIFLFMHLIMMIGVFVFFYGMQDNLLKNIPFLGKPAAARQ